MGWFGLGKPRSRFGKFIDELGVSQQELSILSGVNRNTISQLANDDGIAPSWKVERKLIRALRQFDSEVSSEDFWG